MNLKAGCSIFLIISLVSCKESHQETLIDSETMAVDDLMTGSSDFEDLEENSTTADSSLDLDNRNDHEVGDTDYEYQYDKFDPIEVLKRLQLDTLLQERKLKTLLSASIRPGDSLRPYDRVKGDGHFNTYMLSSQGVDIVEFYHEDDTITDIQILDALAVPDHMIRPGLTYGDLINTYDNPIAYGSEIEARVNITVDGVSFRMATSYGVYEPIDLEDDIEILLIQF